MRITHKREEVIVRIRAAARKLYLSGSLGDLCENNGTLQQTLFMMEALEQELCLREENAKKRLIRRACFPAVKSFAGYDYSHVTIPPAMPQEDLERRHLSAAGRTWSCMDLLVPERPIWRSQQACRHAAGATGQSSTPLPT